MAQSQLNINQPLPSKEGALFKQVLKLHETKQYKKAIKCADQILKKVPEHGETLAMKGLLVRSLATDNEKDKKEEAYELVRRGLKSDLKSHVCWHVYGLLYRQDREYKEAIKCYLNALRIDKENMQIMRDLALLQIQMRDLQGFVETRQQLLALKPNNRSNWITFVVAHHMNGNHEMAVQVLDEFLRTLDDVPASEAYEHSELLLYRATVLAEAGKVQEAYDSLESSKDKIKDRQGLTQMSADLLLRLGRSAEAEALYRQLLAQNPNNYKMHEALCAALGLSPDASGKVTDEQRAKLTALYDELQREYPGSSACRRIPLDFKEGDEFRAAADVYMRRYLQRGIPSLYVDVRPLYRDPAKASAVLALAEGYADSLRSCGRLPPLSGQQLDAGRSEGEGQEAADLESPQTLVWVLLFLARHYDRQGRLDLALQAVDEALRHTPTCVELYTAKAKILKHAGDVQGAAVLSETARRMDLQDRYLNSAAVKALLLAGHMRAAERTAALFTRDGDAQHTLYDMQHMWYEVSAGRAYAAARQPGPSLKKFLAVAQHFADMAEDQFDFHSYCVRKGTLRAYTAMLAVEDKLYSHDFYSKAAGCAVRVYLNLYDHPPSASNGTDEEARLAGMSAEERKKYKLQKKKEEKARKAAEEKEREERERREKEAAAAKAAGKKGQAAAKREPDPDPDGAKLAATSDPLGEASKLVAQLVAHAGHRLQTHVLAAEVALRKGRLLMALGALQRAAKLAEGGADHPELHLLLVKLALAAKQQPPAQPVVREVLEQGLAVLLGGPPAARLAAYCADWHARNGAASLAQRVAAAQAQVLLRPEAKAEAVQHILAEDLGSCAHDHEECARVHKLLEQAWGDAAAAGQWRAACAAAFPHSRYFGGAALLPLEPEYDFTGLQEAFGKLSF